MSERMTGIRAEGLEPRVGLQECGGKTCAEMIEAFRQYYEHQLAEAQKVARTGLLPR